MREISLLKMDTEEQTEEQTETQQPSAPAPKRRGRPKKVREEGGVVSGETNPRRVVHSMHHPTPQPLSSGFWMGLLKTQREMELEAKRDRHKRFSIA